MTIALRRPHWRKRGLRFVASRIASIIQSLGSGTLTITRATTATVMGYAADAVLADGQMLLTVASGELRFQGARRISEGVWSTVDADGVPIPDATLDGALVEAAATQYLGVTGTPATQTTASLDTGTYTLWVEGTGSALASAGTATISGEAAAEEDSPNTFTVSGAGTVTVTVTGSLTTFNLTNTPYQTSYIANTGAAGTSATRNKDVLDDQVSGNLTAAAGSVAFEWTPSHDPSGTVALGGSYVDADNYTVLLAQKVTNKISAPENLNGANWTRQAGASVTQIAGSEWEIDISACANWQGVYVVSTNLSASGAKSINSVSLKVMSVSGDNTVLYAEPINGGFTPATKTLTTEWQRVVGLATDGGSNTSGLWVQKRAGGATLFRLKEPMIEEVTANVNQTHPAPYTATTATFAIFRKVIAGVAYDSYIPHEYANGTTAKVAIYWGASGLNLAVDGVLGTAHANTDPAQLGTRWQWGADGNGGQQAGACFKHKRLWIRSFSNSEIQEHSASSQS